MHSLAKLVCTMQQGVRRVFHRNDVAIVQPGNPINVKEPANLFRLATSVLLMAKEYCRYFIV